MPVRLRLAVVAATLLACGEAGGPASTGTGRPTARPSGEVPGERPPPVGEPAAPVGPEPVVPPEAPPTWPPLQDEVPVWRLEVGTGDLARLEANPDDRDLEVPGRFEADGVSLDVRVRYRGRSTRYLPKKSFELRFAEGVRFEGRTRLQLLAEWKDGGLLTEKLWYDLAAAFGLRVPRARWVELELNGEPYGVMTEIERVDKAFLVAHGFDPDADVYRCGMHDCELKAWPRFAYQEEWTKHTNESRPWDELWALLETVNGTPSGALGSALEATLDLDAYLRWMAVDTAIANYAQADSRSFLIYDRREARWTYVPWDLNNALSLFNRTHALTQAPQAARPWPGFTAYDPLAHEQAARRRRSIAEFRPPWSVLSTRVLDDPALRARFRGFLAELLEGRFREEELAERAVRAHALLADAAARDRFVDPAFFAAGPDFLSRFVRERREYLLAHLPDIDTHGRSALAIDRVGRLPDGRWFADLANRDDEEKSLAGLYLAAELRRPATRAPAERLPPGGVLRLVEGDGLPPPVQGELGLFDDDGETPLDLFFVPPLAPGEAYGRAAPDEDRFGPVPTAR